MANSASNGMVGAAPKPSKTKAAHGEAQYTAHYPNTSGSRH
jgi:hypothetical protein